MKSVMVDSLRIAYLEDGPVDGRAVVMVHGFPDGPWTFDHLAEKTADEGFRVIRPYLRGYTPTEIPPDRRIAMPDLVADLNGLARALDLTDPLLVGHDWGGVIGWEATGHAGHPWHAFVALAIPPPPVLSATPFDLVQAFYRSGYMWWMQVPGIERVMPRLVEYLYRRWSPGWDPPADHLDRVRRMLSVPRAARAAAGYYRWMVPASLTGTFPRDATAIPQIPLRYIHGRNDTCFPASAAARAARYLPPDTVQIVDDAGHFLHLEQPQIVTDLVIHSLRRAA